MRAPFLAVVAMVHLVGCDPSKDRTSATSSSTTSDPAAPSSIPPAPRRGDDPTAIEYSVGFEHAHKHLVDVEMNFASSNDQSELVLAVWTPGSYLVREYARHIEGLEVRDVSGTRLKVTKVRKNRWRIIDGGTGQLSVRYRIYAREQSVRTNFVDDELASIVGAATFMTVEGRQADPHDVVVVPRPGWTRVVTGLDPHPSGNPNRFLAANYDELVDSPIAAGSPVETSFREGERDHTIASFAATPSWDATKSTDDVAKIVREQQAFWGVVPYNRYLIINLMLSGGGMGGLEHLDSTLLIANRHTMAKKSRYRSWLGLVSHEVFHTWNGKRLRPQALGPFDYENEVYTEDLWIVEGLTSYYDDLTLVRAGLYTEKQYLEALGSQIATLQKTPGRDVQPLDRASYDAWIKYYRRDENSANTSISYYTKGAVVGFLLDMMIRRLSGERRSLDDVMRGAYQRYSGARGYTSSEFQALASEAAGSDLSQFFERAVSSTEELEYKSALDFVGLRFAAVKPKDDGDERPSYLGVSIDGRGKVTRVVRGTPAFEAGINVQDELLAISSERVGSALEPLLERHKPGADVEVLISRRGKVRTLRVKLADPLTDQHELERQPSRSSAQSSRATNWLAPVAR